MTLMPHLATLTWDEEDRLRSTARQAASGGGAPQTAYYAYNASGQRVRKVTDQQAASGQAAARKTERIYLGAVEIYREYSGDGTTIILEHETLRLSDGKDNRPRSSRPGPPGTIRPPHSWCVTSTAMISARPCSNSTTRRTSFLRGVLSRTAAPPIKR